MQAKEIRTLLGQAYKELRRLREIKEFYKADVLKHKIKKLQRKLK